MPNQLSPQRRKVVVLCASVAIFSGLTGAIQRARPHWTSFWIGLLCGLLAYTLVQFVKLKQEERR